MLVSPIATYAPRAAALLDAAAHTLDGNITIRGVGHQSIQAISLDYKGDVRRMASDAEKIVPTDCPDEVRDLIAVEAESLRILAKASGFFVPYLFTSAQHAVGTTGYPATLKRDPRFNRKSRTEGLVHRGASTLGVSCPFTVQDSGFAATRGFWIDNLTGLPTAEWLNHRSEELNYVCSFTGGPWDGQVLADSTILNVSVDSCDVFTDYTAQRFAIQDSKHGMLFRFAWTGADHSILRGDEKFQHTESDDIAEFQYWIVRNVM